MGFSISEIIVILVVALLVIRPEQLPEVAYTLGRFAQTLRRLFGKMQHEVNGWMEALPEPAEKKREQP